MAPRWLVLGAWACGSSGSGDMPANDGGLQDAGVSHLPPHDAAHLVDVAEEPAPPRHKTPLNRLNGHAQRVVSSMHLVAIYFGDLTSGGSPSFDPLMTWLVTSEYWTLLQQYGVGAGAFVGSVQLAATDVFMPGVAPKTFLAADEVDARIRALLHPAGSDGGADGADAGDAGSAGDAGTDAGAETGAPPAIPTADAYIVFLPNGVNVLLDGPNGAKWQTCVEAGGYHSFDGDEAYAVIPPCSFGRSALAISHELAEMATDPLPGEGWWSEADNASSGGGEIGDLCNAPVSVEGWAVTKLWSNKDGDCEPNP